MRSWLLWLAVVGSCLSLAVASVSGWWAWQDEKASDGASLVAASQAIVESVDRELDQAVALARGLSTSPLLAASDFAGFGRQARQAISGYHYQLILLSPNLHVQLVNTELSAGTAPLAFDRPAVDPMLRQDRVRVAPLHRSPVTGTWFAAVEVPVLGPNRDLRFVIDMLVPSTAFQRIIDGEHLPKSWSPVILDSDWTVVARDVYRKKFLGQKAAGEQFRGAPDGLHDVRLLDGDHALSAHSHSQQYGWTAAVAMPTRAILEDALDPILAAAGTGFAVAAFAVGTLLIFAAYISRRIRSLARATNALVTGEAVHLPRFLVRELVLVGDDLKRAAEEIAANRHGLEARVAAATAELQRESDKRRRAEIALAQAQRLEALGQLTSGFAHDFNNLLTVISGNLELIENKSADAPVVRLARNAQRGTARGAQLVQALLAFARRQPLRSEIVNPNLAIQEFMPVLKGAAGGDVELRLVLSPEPFYCQVDSAQLQSALLNLVVNARAAMPSGGRITIATANIEDGTGGELALDLEAGSYVEIAVADSGNGMPSDVLQRAFDPFYTTKEVGTGLGLSQVYGFAKQSGGHATASSAEGSGTVVRLYLPRALPGEADVKHGELPPQANCAGKSVVMIVDDDPDVRAMLVEAVSGLGYRVIEAADGREALSRISDGERVDLVLTDYLMPGGLTGRELAQCIAGLGHEIPLVLISGNVAIDAENTEFPVLRKPIRLAELSHVIAKMLDRDAG